MQSERTELWVGLGPSLRSSPISWEYLRLMMLNHKYALVIIRRQFKEFKQSRQVLGWSLKYSWLTLSLTPCVKRPQPSGKCSWKQRAGFNFMIIIFNFWSLWDDSRKVKDIFQGLLSCGLLPPAVIGLPCQQHTCCSSQNETQSAYFWSITPCWQRAFLMNGSLGFVG